MAEKYCPEEIVDSAENTKGDTTLQLDFSEDILQICPPVVDEKNEIEGNLTQNLAISGDKLLFILFTPANTLRPQWFLVQVVLPEPGEMAATPGNYFCTFLQKHPKDNKLPDNKSRWWPEWRELLWENDESYDFGDRILFGPTQKPDLTLFGKFGTEVNFNDPKALLVGPFNFLARSPSRTGFSFISDAHWKTLANACKINFLAPPTLSNALLSTIAQASTYRSSLIDHNFTLDLVNQSSLCSMLYLF
jgi:hypothetical protein